MQSRTIARRLRAFADILDEAADDGSVTIARRRGATRHAPFLRELAQRAVFCTALGQPRLSMSDPLHEVLGKMQQLVELYRLPTRSPFTADQWAMLLADVRLGDAERPYLPSSGAILAFKSLRVRLFHEPLWGEFTRGDRIEADVTAVLFPPVGVSQPMARAWLAEQLMAPLEAFRDATRTSTFTEFTVWLMGPPKTESTVTQHGPETWVKVGRSRPGPGGQFTVADRRDGRRRRIDAIANEIAGRSLPYLRKMRFLEPGQGRLPDTKRVARWWAQVVFDGRSAAEIAESEAGTGKDPEDLRETIERQLRKLGLPLE